MNIKQQFQKERKELLKVFKGKTAAMSYQLRPGQSASFIFNNSWFSIRKLHPLTPSNTLVRQGSSCIYHWDEGRFISIIELKRLFTFPDTFNLIGSRSAQWARIGNSVPPLFMRAVSLHIKSKLLQKNNPTVISTFAGCGGSSLGHQMAGYKELLAIEWDSHAVECFKLNFNIPMWQKDINKVKTSDILSFCKLKEGELDVFEGSPPCQGFSMAKGKRDITDSRNDLFKPYLRLLEGLMPKAFVIENVPGMIRGKMKSKFNEIFKSLQATGYQVKCKQMNAANYSVPQARQRLIFIGVRDDLNIQPSFPKPHGKIISVYEALKDLYE